MRCSKSSDTTEASGYPLQVTSVSVFNYIPLNINALIRMHKATMESQQGQQRHANPGKRSDKIIPPAVSSQTEECNDTIESIFNTMNNTEKEVAESLAKIRMLILKEGIPVPLESKQASLHTPFTSPTGYQHYRIPRYEQQRLRSQTWKMLLGVYHVSFTEYACLVKKGRSEVYDKVHDDTFRTLATDREFSTKVYEDSLIRVLNAFVWKEKEPTKKIHASMQHFAELPARPSGKNSLQFTYVQGMNVLAAPFLYTMPEVEAFFTFSTMIRYCCPLYVQPLLQGVHCGVKLLDMCLQAADPELFGYLRGKNLTAELYAFPSILTLSACTPPLDQILQLWDFLFAFGVHLNVLCIVARLMIIRIDLLQSPSPMKLLRTLPSLEARVVIPLTVSLARDLPPALYKQLARHPYDDCVAEELDVRVGSGINSLYMAGSVVAVAPPVMRPKILGEK
ncbi:rab-GTPase-TBC domain-containing protein [Endogone sp. FLAS-F59071]|nr:rab-GTPase-TBC domain-containing protein [Endogone sp. FLAS-F59071]|eukprot:RUS21432.1 rab-GTPase-TBC domain-containing protein [Endogone sp. FLAS-F59071]